MSYRETLAKDRRLVILRLLQQSSEYAANEHLLHAALAEFGHAVGSDVLRADLTWLEEQRLVMLRDIAGVTIATATIVGVDVALGRAHNPGVARPRPGE